MNTSVVTSNKSISVAPMLDLTDRHCRAFLRLFSPHIRLYTEMVVVGSIIHGDKQRFFGFDQSEHPVAIQLGGCDPPKLAVCSRLAEEWGYDEVNINIGCPSDRVKNAQFGACLMAKPELVRDCVQAMIESVSIPVTVKTRLGIDELDSYDYLAQFVETVAQSGCQEFLVHARKAWLQGLSPKENRTIPELMYDRVYKLKQDFPELKIVLNGGVTSLDEVDQHLSIIDGVMIGREAYQNPWFLQEIDQYFYQSEVDVANNSSNKTRIDIVHRYIPYIEKQLAQGVYLRHMTRHILGLFHGQPGAKSWRRYLSENGPKKEAGIEVVYEALKYVDIESAPNSVAA